MSALPALLLLCLFAAVALCAYQLSDVRRWRRAATELQADCAVLRSEAEEANREVVRRDAEIAKAREVGQLQLKFLTQTQEQLEQRFRALAADALQNNSQLFLERTREQFQHVVEPVNQSLRRFEEQVQAIEKSRIGAYESVTAQIHGLTELQERVRQSTDQLKTALRSPVQRGRWGEIQLRRVVEIAGMLEYCDFAEQETLFGERRQRPDLIVRLPNQCQVVVDSKVSLEAYLRAVECQSEVESARHFVDHARQVRTHVKALSEKAYWQQLPCSPEFVVAFLPLESLFSAALEHDPELLAFAALNRVVIASPITLITLLLTVSHGWHQQTMAENLKGVAETGARLYERLLTMSQHFSRLGDAIEKTVATYNSTIGSFENSVLVSARKFKSLHSANSEQINELREIDAGPRQLKEDARRASSLTPADPPRQEPSRP